MIRWNQLSANCIPCAAAIFAAVDQVTSCRSSEPRVGVFPHFEARDRPTVDFVRAVGEPKRADICIGIRKAGVRGHTHAAMGLDRVIDHAECHSWRRDLDHRNLEPRGLVANLIHHIGGPET
jgi:hypothetical protein